VVVEPQEVAKGRLNLLTAGCPVILVRLENPVVVLWTREDHLGLLTVGCLVALVRLENLMVVLWKWEDHLGHLEGVHLPILLAMY